jgi:hypothetical protein
MNTPALGSPLGLPHARLTIGPRAGMSSSTTRSAITSAAPTASRVGMALPSADDGVLDWNLRKAKSLQRVPPFEVMDA